MREGGKAGRGDPPVLVLMFMALETWRSLHENEGLGGAEGRRQAGGPLCLAL